MRAEGRSGFTLASSEYAAAHKWVTAARIAMRRNIAPGQFVEMIFSMESSPVPWKFIALSGKLKTERVRMAESEMSQGDYIRYKLKWSMRVFSNFGEIGSREYFNAMIDLPVAVGVQPWVRVLLGYQQPEVLRMWLPEALEFFETRPDIVRTCLDLGFPPLVLKSQQQ